jgi:hypothetical protein
MYLTNFNEDNGWVCCNCGAHRGEEVYGEKCRECLHYRCNNCDDPGCIFGGGESWGYSAASSSPTLPEATDNPMLHLRAYRRRLRVLLDYVLVEKACADSGCEVNCISEAYLSKIGVRISQSTRGKSFNLPVEGRSISSFSVILVNCRFPHAPFMPQMCEFFVFKKLICDVILGRQFLRDTRTLDNHQERFEDINRGPRDTAIARSVGTVREHVHCWLNETPIWSLPDTGAEVNLISSKFAKKLGYDGEIEGLPINKTDPIWIEFADCSSIKTQGTVDITVSFSDPVKSQPPVCRLVESHPGPKSNVGTGKIGSNYRVSERFYIIGDLRQDVILGETLLSTVDAYNQHAGNFRAATGTDRWIAIGRKKKIGEGNGNPKPPLNEELQFKDDFSCEYDRVQREMEQIESQGRRLEISEELAIWRKQQVSETHIVWIRKNREHLDRYYAGYYEKNVPQELV